MQAIGAQVESDNEETWKVKRHHKSISTVENIVRSSTWNVSETLDNVFFHFVIALFHLFFCKILIDNACFRKTHSFLSSKFEKKTF